MFANGAAFAAFSIAVQGIASSIDEYQYSLDGTGEDASSLERDQIALRKEIDALVTDGTLDTHREFATADDAAKEVLNAVAPLAEKYNLEVGGNIYESKNGYQYFLPKVGTRTGATIRGNALGYHTHPNRSVLKFSNQFSNAGNGSHDIGTIRATGYGGYLGIHHNGKTSIGFCDTSCRNVGIRGTSPKRIVQ